MAKTQDIQLPNGYVCPREGIVKQDVTVREISGDDEDFLRDKGETSKKNVMARFLARVVTEIDGSKDRGYIDEVITTKGVFCLADYPTTLIVVRSLSEGEYYSRSVKCPECELKQIKRVNLSKLPMEKAEPLAGVEEITAGEWTITLPEHYGVMRFRRPLFSDLRMKADIEMRYPKQRATHEMLLQVLAIDEQDPKPKEVASWPSRIRNHMRAAMDSVVSGVNVELTHKCKDPECGHSWEEPMGMDLSSFFFKKETGISSRQETSTDESKSSLPSGTTLESWLTSGAGRRKASSPSEGPNDATT